MLDIKFCNDVEFENLPYDKMEEKVGVCDRENGKIFVRASGIKPLDTFNAIHEIEHMAEGEWGKYAHHRDQNRPGVYYKGFSDIFDPIANVASVVPGPWQAPAAIYSGVKGGMSMFGGGGGQQQQQEPSVLQTQSPMQASQAPQAPQPSVIQPSQGSSGVGGPQMSGGSLTDRVRAFFSGRNPTQEFGKTSQSFTGGV